MFYGFNYCKNKNKCYNLIVENIKGVIYMATLKNEDIIAVKGKGFLRNRGTDKFSGRILSAGTVFTAENFKALANWYVQAVSR